MRKMSFEKTTTLADGVVLLLEVVADNNGNWARLSQCLEGHQNTVLFEGNATIDDILLMDNFKQIKK